MSRYIDAKWLEDNAKEYSLGYYEEDEWATPLNVLDSAPSIDIVRCGECKYCKCDVIVERRVSGYERAVNICRHPRFNFELVVNEDWFCADGERKE